MTLAAGAPGAPGGNSWNLTFWDSGPVPAGTYNALVVASPEGAWFPSPSYAALDAASLTYGNRIMVTGQDADWHYDPSNAGGSGGPGPGPFNGPRGFLYDAINWAASGTGMGAVFLGAQNALQAPGLSGFTFGVIPGGETDTVLIPAGNWIASAHGAYAITDATKWVAINTEGDLQTPITIVSAPGDGPLTPPSGVPEPATLTLVGLGLAAARAARKARRGIRRLSR
jgi:hypothetical protein